MGNEIRIAVIRRIALKAFVALVALATTMAGGLYPKDAQANGTPPAFAGGAAMSANNHYVDVTFTEGVEGDKQHPLTPGDFQLALDDNNGTGTAAACSIVSLTDPATGKPPKGGETTVRFGIFCYTPSNGHDFIEILPADGASVFSSADQTAMDAAATTGKIQMHAYSAANEQPYLSSPVNNVLMTKGDSIDVPLASSFEDPDGDPLTFEAYVVKNDANDPDIMTATLDPETWNLTIAASEVGQCDIFVYAKDDRGLAKEIFFTVNVHQNANQAPAVAQSLPDVIYLLGDPDSTLNLNLIFKDDDGDALSFTASSSDENVATTAVNAYWLTVHPVAVGTTTVTVTATDGMDAASASYQVQVTAVGYNVGKLKLNDQFTGTPDQLQGDAGFFGNKSGATLTLYVDGNHNGAVESEEKASAVPLGTTDASGGFGPVDIGDYPPGTVSFVIEAADPGAPGALLVPFELTFVKNVMLNNYKPIYDQWVTPGADPIAFKLGDYFFGTGPLAFSAESDNPSAISVDVTGDLLTVAAVPGAAYAEAANVKITVHDIYSSYANTVTFKVGDTTHVQPTIEAIGDRSLTAGDVWTTDLNATLDPTAGKGTYSAVVDDESVVSASIDSSGAVPVLTLSALHAGTANITVRVHDYYGGSATTAFVVTVAAATTERPAIANLAAANNAGASDVLTASGLSAGDLVKVYDALTGGNLIGSGSVANGATTAQLSLALPGSGAGVVYVTATSPGKLESAPRVEVHYGAEPSAGSVGGGGSVGGAGGGTGGKEDGAGRAAAGEALLAQANRAGGPPDGVLTLGSAQSDAPASADVPASVLATIAAGDPDATLRFVAGGVSFDTPIGRIDWKGIADALGVGLEGLTIRLDASPVATGEQEEMRRNADRQGLHVVGAYGFSATAVGGDREWEIRDFGGAYADKTIRSEQSGLTAALYDPATGRYTFVPFASRTVDGVTVYSLRVPHNSVYALLSETNVTFPDLERHWAKTEASKLANLLLVQGVSANAFEPDRFITRAEAIALVVRGIGLSEKPEAAGAFGDVAAGAWYAGAVGAAYGAKLIDGYGDGTIRPDERINREQLAVLIDRASAFAQGTGPAEADAGTLGRFEDGGAVSEWAKAALSRAVEAGYLQGQSAAKLAGKAFATRAETTVIVGRLLRKLAFIPD